VLQGVRAAVATERQLDRPEERITADERDRLNRRGATQDIKWKYCGIQEERRVRGCIVGRDEEPTYLRKRE